VSESGPTWPPEVIEPLKQQCDKALEALLNSLDALYNAIDACSTVDRVVVELADEATYGREGTYGSERWNFLADETRLWDLELALRVVQARIQARNSSLMSAELADISPDELRTAVRP
jgi:hypothetical protein